MPSPVIRARHVRQQPVTGASAITLAHQSAGCGEPVGAIAAPASAAGLAGVRTDRRGPHRLSTWTPPAGGSWGPKQADSLLPAGDRGAVQLDEVRGPSTTVRSAQTTTDPIRSALLRFVRRGREGAADVPPGDGPRLALAGGARPAGTARP